MSSCSSSEKSEKLCCCFSGSLLFSATRLRVVVGPAATLGLVLDEVVVGPPDDIVLVSKRRRIFQNDNLFENFVFFFRFLIFKVVVFGENNV